MKRLIARSFVVSVSLLVAGCTQYWAKPGGTKEEFEATKAACNSQSYAQFPPIMQQIMVSPGYTTPAQTTCTSRGQSVDCYSTGGNYVPPSYVLVDQNDSARDSAFRSCLYAAGWIPVKNQEEAAAVTNSAPAAATGASSSSKQTDWDTTRANCRLEAERSHDPFPNAFILRCQFSSNILKLRGILAHPTFR